VIDPADVLASHRELIANLQDGLAFTDERFATLVRPVLGRYAAFVHLLPASEAHHHRGTGGLFHHGLEVAFFAARASQGLIFALERSPGERRALEPRWHLAAGLAGLCHDLGKPIADLAVTDRDGATAWRPLLESLSDWAAAQSLSHYYLRWRRERHHRHEAFGLLVLARVLTPEVTAWLADPDPAVLEALLTAVAGTDPEAVLGRLVRGADQASVEQDLRENRLDPMAASFAVPVERHLLDAMRRLARSGRWRINVPGARLWLLPEGLHIVWPAGAQDMVALLAEDKVPGIPRDPDTLADILLERGLAVPRGEGGPSQRYWRLAPEPLARDGDRITLTLLRLASPDLVLTGGAVPAPVAVIPQEDQTPALGAAPSAPKDLSGAMDAPPAPPVAQAEHGANPVVPVPPPEGPPHEPPPGVDGPVDEARPAAAHRAAAWLRARGEGGVLLLALADVLAHTDGTWAARVQEVEAGLLVRFPEGLAGLGAAPPAVLDALAQAGLLQSDPRAPLRRVREIAGLRGALLTREAAQALIDLAGAPPAAGDAVPAADPIGQPRAAAGDSSAVVAAEAAAAELIALIRARDPGIPGGVSETGGRLAVGTGVAGWFVASRPGLNRFALLRALGQQRGCRVTPNGGLTLDGAS
jgi:conjugal transfer pilus assembly protein TraI